MDLKEFVTEALAQIVEGVSDARSRVEALGGFVNPPDQNAAMGGVKSALPSVKIPGQGYYPFALQLIDFDVAVVVSDEVTKKMGMGVLTVVTAGGQRESTRGQETTTRIKFQVPLVLPHHNAPSIADRKSAAALSPPRQDQSPSTAPVPPATEPPK